MMHAYSPLYLSKTSRTVGNMLHDAVEVYEIPGDECLRRFIQSDVAAQFECGKARFLRDRF